MKASLFLAASAIGGDGEISALRIGLATVVPGQPFAIGGVIEIPWLQAVDEHTFRVELVEEDGTPFEVTQPNGSREAVLIEGKGGTGIPHGHRVGSPRIVTLVGNFALPLAFGMRYEFRLSIDGETDPAWTVGFDTPAEPLTQAA